MLTSLWIVLPDCSEKKNMEKLFDIEDYGASPDKDLNTPEIQSALDDCHKAGGGRVVCGPGTFVTGSLELKSNVELYLASGCVLKGSEDLADYPDFEADGFKRDKAPEKTTKHLIRAINAENIAISGCGEINGSGLSFYSSEELEMRRKPGERPRIVMFYKCRKVRLQDASFSDSPCWTVWLMKCEDVFVNRVKIAGDRRLINNDGIDIDSCSNVIVSDSLLNTEDDCIVIRAIGSVYDIPGVCENVVVANCVLYSNCNAVRVGCPGDSVIRKCVFSNITINGPCNGVILQNPKRYLPSDNSAGADISGLVFSNFTVDCSGIPIWIFVEEGISLKRLSGLSFSNFRIRSKAPCIVQGSSQTVIRNISFSDFDIETESQDAILCRSCSEVRFNNVKLNNKEKIYEAV